MASEDRAKTKSPVLESFAIRNWGPVWLELFWILFFVMKNKGKQWENVGFIYFSFFFSWGIQKIQKILGFVGLLGSYFLKIILKTYFENVENTCYCEIIIIIIKM